MNALGRYVEVFPSQSCLSLSSMYSVRRELFAVMIMHGNQKSELLQAKNTALLGSISMSIIGWMEWNTH